MSSKDKGRRREHQARDALIAKGYLVTRAAGSLGAFDLIAIPTVKADERAHLRLVQVKSNVWPRPPERREIERIGRTFPPGARYSIEIWRYDDGHGVQVLRWLYGGWVQLLEDGSEAEKVLESQ